MNDEWRVLATVETERFADEIAQRLRRGDLEHGLGTEAGERVIVSTDHHRVFMYAGSRSQAEAAADAVRKLAKDEEFEAEFELRHWRPDAEEWEDPEHPLPTGGAGLSAGQLEMLATERAESRKLGYAEFEVRVELPSHEDTLEFAAELQRRRIPYVRRWRFVLIGAADEQQALNMADQIERISPEGSTVSVEGSTAAVLAQAPQNPFAVLGGLGG